MNSNELTAAKAGRVLKVQVHDDQVERVLAELEQLENRTARVILRPRVATRAERLAALMNWLIYGRWPEPRPGPTPLEAEPEP